MVPSGDIRSALNISTSIGSSCKSGRSKTHCLFPWTRRFISLPMKWRYFVYINYKLDPLEITFPKAQSKENILFSGETVVTLDVTTERWITCSVVGVCFEFQELLLLNVAPSSGQATNMRANSGWPCVCSFDILKSEAKSIAWKHYTENVSWTLSCQPPVFFPEPTLLKEIYTKCYRKQHLILPPCKV